MAHRVEWADRVPFVSRSSPSEPIIFFTVRGLPEMCGERIRRTRLTRPKATLDGKSMSICPLSDSENALRQTGIALELSATSFWARRAQGATGERRGRKSHRQGSTRRGSGLPTRCPSVRGAPPAEGAIQVRCEACLNPNRRLTSPRGGLPERCDDWHLGLASQLPPSPTAVRTRYPGCPTTQTTRLS